MTNTHSPESAHKDSTRDRNVPVDPSFTTNPAAEELSTGSPAPVGPPITCSDQAAADFTHNQMASNEEAANEEPPTPRKSKRGRKPGGKNRQPRKQPVEMTATPDHEEATHPANQAPPHFESREYPSPSAPVPLPRQRMTYPPQQMMPVSPSSPIMYPGYPVPVPPPYYSQHTGYPPNVPAANEERSHPQLMTPAQVARRLGIKVTTLANWRCNKRYALPYVKVGRKIAYRQEDVNQFIETRLQGC